MDLMQQFINDMGHAECVVGVITLVLIVEMLAHHHDLYRFTRKTPNHEE